MTGMERGGRADDARDLEALLTDLHELRLMVSADLGLAASAVEVGAYDIAADAVGDGADDVRDFAARADGHLRRATGVLPGAVPAPNPDLNDDVPQVVPLHRRRRRWEALRPVAPALAAAAALVGVLVAVVPHLGTRSADPVTLAATPVSSYAELFRLLELGAPAPVVRQAAQELHAEIERLVQNGPPDPQTASEALRLLELEAAAIEASEHRDELADTLAETRRLVALLRQAVAQLGEPGTRLGDAVAPRAPQRSPRTQSSPQASSAPPPASGQGNTGAQQPPAQPEQTTPPSSTAPPPSEPADGSQYELPGVVPSARMSLFE